MFEILEVDFEVMFVYFSIGNKNCIESSEKKISLKIHRDSPQQAQKMGKMRKNTKAIDISRIDCGSQKA